MSDLREEYEFADGERGKYSSRVSRDVVMIALDPDVADAFPTAAAVNRALRGLIGPRSKSPGTRGAAKKRG